MFWKDSRYVTGRLCGKMDWNNRLRWLSESKWRIYSFVLKIEEVARSFMTVDLMRKNQKEDMREIFKVKLITVPEVSAIRVSLSRKMLNRQLSNKLFKQIIEKWIDLRAYVTVFVQILKRKINSLPKEMKKVYSVEPIKKAEPAFRKTLT